MDTELVVSPIVMYTEPGGTELPDRILPARVTDVAPSLIVWEGVRPLNWRRRCRTSPGDWRSCSFAYRPYRNKGRQK